MRLAFFSTPEQRGGEVAKSAERRHGSREDAAERWMRPPRPVKRVAGEKRVGATCHLRRPATSGEGGGRADDVVEARTPKGDADSSTVRARRNVDSKVHESPLVGSPPESLFPLPTAPHHERCGQTLGAAAPRSRNYSPARSTIRERAPWRRCLHFRQPPAHPGRRSFSAVGEERTATRDVGTPRNDRHSSRRTKTERQLRDGRQTESERTGSGGNCGTSGATRYIERVNGHSARGWRTRGEHVRPARRHAVRVATLDGRRGRSICNSRGTSGARAFRGQDLGRR